MNSGTETAVRPDQGRRQPAEHRIGGRMAALIAVAAVLVFICGLSLAVGSAALPLSTVWAALTDRDQSIDHITVMDVRLPRTLLGLLVGAALGVAGALMQAVGRNPLADPGILGVNAGAGLAVAVGVAYLGLTTISEFVWLGMVGAVVAAVLVAAIAARGPGGATPLRLTLVGVALTAVLNGLSLSLSLVNPSRFERMRFWGVGSITDRPPGTVEFVAPFIVAGLVLALAASRSLNVLALGDDVARSVGARLGLTRAAAVVSLVLLCGAATAAAGPIAFVGLMVPHAVRMLVGADQRWVIAFSALAGPVLVLAADLFGRVVVRPEELEVGIVTPLFGAPVLIWLVRRTRRL
ncbi:iron chelate uptake ABC transporter family permease subunit [Gordonia sihwensis]|uniref:iron chelate uptake ABC transporter family permease subunit n=1 Tax=Gordonia TaxID=2053 RepID=UPI0024167061|nr:iron chelate uptake ABC transporter family permease subunit [Gordonia sihwensis]WFN91632.1 iron chelate uptake ABC transporter family permease subunit [Gordonia sihwensis]